MGNSLVEAKNRGIADFEALPEKIHSQLDSLANQINSLEGGLTRTSVSTRLQQSELLNQGFMACGDDAMTFGAWFNADDTAAAPLSIPIRTARDIIYLGKFSKGKKVEKLETVPLSALYQLAQPKWVVDKNTGEPDPAKQKALGLAYDRLTKTTPRNQSAVRAKELIEDELLKANISLPPSPPVKKLTVIQMESKIERLLNDVRMGFSVEDRESLKRFIIAEMGGW